MKKMRYEKRRIDSVLVPKMHNFICFVRRFEKHILKI